MNKEKRQSLRKESEYLIELFDSGGSILKGVGHLLDLSATGALIESPLHLSLGQVLLARLRRGDRVNLELPVTVTRVRGKGSRLTYGLKFNRH